MKIIAKTDGGYLVDATGYELIQVAGHKVISEHPVAKQVRADTGYAWVLPIGAQIDVTARFRHLIEMEGAREQAISSAAALRGLAALVEKSIPEGLIVPEAPAEGQGDD